MTASKTCQVFGGSLREWGSLPHNFNHHKTRRSTLDEMFKMRTVASSWPTRSFSELKDKPCGGKNGPCANSRAGPSWAPRDRQLTILPCFYIVSLAVRKTSLPSFVVHSLRPTSNHRVWIRSGQVHLVMPGCMVDRARTPRTLGSGGITLSEVRCAV